MVALHPPPVFESGPLLLENAAWFDANWMFVSAVLCPISVVALLIVFPGSIRERIRNPYFVGWLLIPFYCWHQFEEHAYDMRGWRYAFVPRFNYGIGPILFFECEKPHLGHLLCPLEPRLTTYINVPSVWLGFAVTMIVAHKLGGPYAFAGHCNWGIAVINGASGHVIPWIFTRAYNPGAFQSIFMVGTGAFFLSKGGPQFFAVCMLCGILFHLVCFGIGINLILMFEFPVETEFLLCFVQASVVPLLLARCAAPAQTKWYEFSIVDSSDSNSGTGSDTDKDSLSDNASEEMSEKGQRLQYPLAVRGAGTK